MRTTDGVGWTVTVGRPRLRVRGGDGGDLELGERDHGAFVPLLLVVTAVGLLLLAPVLLETGRGWLLAVPPVLLVLVAFGHLARYPVDLHRDGGLGRVHRTWVSGRRAARQVAEDLATEIERSADSAL